MSSDWSVSGSSSPTLCTPPNSSSSQLSAISSCSSQSRNSEPSNRPSTSQILKTWPETLQVPWEQMPQEIRSAIADGKRPKPMERRQMVRVLADEMRRYEANPTRAQCLTVVRNIIRQYPKSFADIAPDGSLLCGGYTSLLIQLKNRIENLNRDGSFSFHRSSTAKRGPTDTYGCTRFQPELPPEETDETVEQHRQRLEEIYRQEGAGGAERAEVKNLMELTFSLQHRHINTIPPPDIEDVKSKWPFLFTPRYIYGHFELLTDINVLRSLELIMQECGRAITEYFRGKPTNKNVKDILSNGEDNEMALRVVQLLMAHFGEDITGLILLTDCTQWPVRLIPLLTGEVQVVAQQLPVANLLAYDDLKRAILQRVGRNPKQHQQRFRSRELGDSGRPFMMAQQLNGHLPQVVVGGGSQCRGSGRSGGTGIVHCSATSGDGRVGPVPPPDIADAGYPAG
ncbi:uncharacterized protein LOC127934122 [Carassius gibelio]|uniref:uncharacterized protein LOC127934122 n=1 Tax=Carassius gibelio TaxID=101364 RepID=UPI00227863F3|nr:uncharacterized protein LOC127934122 [Carassius gibelio]